VTPKVAAENAWAEYTEARRVLEDARGVEARAVADRRLAEGELARAEQAWREVLAAVPEGER
jgi:hypothetical protein